LASSVGLACHRVNRDWAYGKPTRPGSEKAKKTSERYPKNEFVRSPGSRDSSTIVFHECCDPAPSGTHRRARRAGRSIGLRGIEVFGIGQPRGPRNSSCAGRAARPRLPACLRTVPEPPFSHPLRSRARAPHPPPQFGSGAVALRYVPRRWATGWSTASHYDGAAKKYLGKVKRVLPGAGKMAAGHLTSRFEFSALKGEGGSHLPHTDAPRKVISLVLSMMRDGEWADRS